MTQVTEQRPRDQRRSREHRLCPHHTRAAPRHQRGLSLTFIGGGARGHKWAQGHTVEEATLQGIVPNGCGAFLTEPDAWGGAWGHGPFQGLTPRLAHAVWGLGHSVSWDPPHPSSHPLSGSLWKFLRAPLPPSGHRGPLEVTHTGRESRGSRWRGGASQPGLPASLENSALQVDRRLHTEHPACCSGQCPSVPRGKEHTAFGREAEHGAQLILQVLDLPGWGGGPSIFLTSTGAARAPTLL